MTRRFTVCLVTRPRCVLLHCNCSKVKHEAKLIVSCVREQKYALTVNSPRSCASVRQQFEALQRGADSAVCLRMLWYYEPQVGVDVASNCIRDSDVTNVADWQQGGAKESNRICGDTSFVYQLIRPSSSPQSLWPLARGTHLLSSC